MERENVAEVLARLYSRDWEVEGLLERAQISRRRLRPWGNLSPEAYWDHVLSELHQGMSPGGRERLLRIALEDYPGNTALQSLVAQPTEVESLVVAAEETEEASSGAYQAAQASENAEFDVFLAHASEDKPLVRELGRLLQKQNLRVWLDEWNLKPGDIWIEELAEILRTTRSAAVLLGPSGIGPWTRLEVQGALMEFVSRGMPVIPVLLPDAQKIELPYFLKSFTWSDLRDGFEEDALDRLEWGITGKKPERRLQKATSLSNVALDPRPWLRQMVRLHGQLTPAPGHRSGLALGHLYVEPGLTERRPHASKERAPEAWLDGNGGRLTLGGLLARDRAKDDGEPKRWLLFGDPGAGKTTMLRHLTMEMAGRGLDAKAGEDFPLPVFESLPRLLRASRDAPYYPEALATQLKTVAGGDAVAWLAELDAYAASGRLVLLFDGLDEVAAGDRDRVQQVLGGVLSRSGWRRVQVLVSSRPIGASSPGSGFQPIEVLPFAEPDRLDFLARWLSEDGPPSTARAQEALQAFKRDRSIWELAGNPLYLTLLAMLYADGVEIPERRSQLYSHIFNFLLEGRHRDGETPIEHDWAVEEVLRDLAWTMTQDGLDAEPRRALVRRLHHSDVTKEALKICAPEWLRDPNLLLEAVAKKTSILGEHDGKGMDWRYWHRTFREALAMERLKALYEADPKALFDHARDRTGADAGRWAEPYALLAGEVEEPDALILALVQKNQALGLRALATAQGLRRETITEILKVLEQALNPENVAVSRVPADWEKRAQVYRQIPGLLEDPGAALDLLERLRREHKDGHDLFFLEEAMIEVGRRWPKAEREVERRRARFFDHMPAPPPEFFTKVETSAEGPVELWQEVEAGRFLMGSPESEPDFDEAKEPLGAFSVERPQHEVYITQPFELMATLVTNRQFRAFDPAHQPRQWGDIEEDELAHHPVVGVSWYQAMAFCRWLDRGGFEGARLPTEAEWEYACRADTATRFWSGNEEADLAEVSWYGANAEARTHRVGEMPSNEWDLFDMHGNVWEWCADMWDGQDYSAREQEQPVADPVEDGDVWNTDEDRVLRGGSWAGPAWNLRAACRGRVGSRFRDAYIGFRVVLCRPPEP